MTYEIKKQQTIDQQILESDIEDPTKFSLNQEYNFAKNDLSNKTDEHESDNQLQNSSDHDSDDSSADGNQTPYTESSDWDSNSSCSSDYSCFLEGGSLLMDLEIPLTKNEEKLIDEFCKEIKGKIEENEREYKTKISKQESIENWTEGALERIKSVVDKYLGKGIKLNSRCNSSEETVVNLIFNEIEVKLDESSKEVFEKLKKSGLSLGGKSVLEAIQDGNFERNRNIATSVIEQPNAATNTPQSYLENIFLNGHNDRTKRIDSRHG